MATAGQLLANSRYRAKAYDRVSIDIPKGKRDAYKMMADELNLSLSMLIQNGVEGYATNHAGEVIAPAPVPVADKLTSEQRKLLDTFADCPDNVKPTLRKLIEQLATNAKNVKDGD